MTGGRPLFETSADDDFRMMALRGLVPNTIADVMLIQAAPRSHPEAIMFVHRQIPKYSHASQVLEIQRRATQRRTLMNPSALGGPRRGREAQMQRQQRKGQAAGGTS